MNRPGCNWGCLLLIAAALAIDVAAFVAMRAGDRPHGHGRGGVLETTEYRNDYGPSCGAAFSAPGDTLATI